MTSFRLVSLRPSRRQRQGVLLLVVLSLLVLFAMIGVTFVLLASQSRRIVRADARAEQYGDDPRKQLDAVFAQIVRDTNNPHSVLQGHSLLNDLYGNDGVKMYFATPNATLSTRWVETSVANGQLWDLAFDINSVTAPETANIVAPPGPYESQVTNAAQLARLQTAGFFNGCVLTVLSGSSAGRSTRIVGWMYDGTSKYTARVMAFEDYNGPMNDITSVLINGRPFNGTGFGLNQTSGQLNEEAVFNTTPQLRLPFALLPNGVFFPRTSDWRGYNSAAYTIFGGLGGFDEDYDAPDPQNMLLAYMPLNPTSSTDIIPSLHRPDLSRYFTEFIKNNNYIDFQNRFAIFRMYTLRPRPEDHNTFPNPTIDFGVGPWDVDNDGDGIADSIWVDVGFPVQTAPDGRRFKPLAAILCLDLDGRLNVNAHGNLAQADQAYYNPIAPGAAGVRTLANYVYSPSGPANVSLPRGTGYGPAEVNLLSLFSSVADYENFFRGVSAAQGTFEGRYGKYGTTPLPFPGRSAAGGPDDILASLKRLGVPQNYYGATSSAYGSPSDVWGRGMVGVDYAGQPILSFFQNPTDVLGAAANEWPHDPYTLNLSRKRIRQAEAALPTLNDHAFTAAELERILRRYDLDAAQMPARLAELIKNSPHDVARLVTTESYDLPSPAVLPTRDMASFLMSRNSNQLPPSQTLVDLLREKLMASGAFTLPADQALLNAQLQLMLPADIIAGRRFDLNRPFGNGVDDNGNGTVDEPEEYTANSESPPAWQSQFGAAIQLDLNNDGSIITAPANPNADVYARQQYARHLYVLMMLLADTNYSQWVTETNLTAPERHELLTRRIAQWAINVVDFRDPDSIMTPFEYDVNPFNGWGVDGDHTTSAGETERRVVWGCEKPELLLTETLALHDRRVKDTPVGDRRADMPPNQDEDLDQVRVPQGSVYFELYCPHNANPSAHSRYSGDLYANDGVQPKLDLGRTAPASANGFQYPVWRIAITSATTDATIGTRNNINARVSPPPTGQPDSINFDPVPSTGSSDPMHRSIFDPANSTPGPVTAERFVWFSAVKPPAGDEDYVYYNRLGTSTLLSPGRYAVVGPRVTTHLGRNVATPTTLSQQKIELLTGGQGSVTFTSNLGVATATGALPIICESGKPPAGWTTNVGVSVSEPLFSSVNYYPAGTVAGPTGEMDTYAAPLDQPLDKSANTPLGKDNLLKTALTQNYKTAILQRLANPLEPFDDVRNPYITVDWQPIDLTVFNGEALQESTPVDFDPDDPGFQTPPGTFVTGSRERGGSVPTDADLWQPYPQQPTSVASPRGAQDVFDYNLVHTLGLLNKAMGVPWATPPASNPTYLGYQNAPDPTSGKTFPWLTWNNRPFASPAELLLVPATSAEQLLRQFSSNLSNGMTHNPYDSTIASTEETPIPTFQSPCRHLLNFLMTSDGTAGRSPYFYRLLEYVQVPSPYVGTETFLNPTAALPAGLKPPFNKVSNYRDPGRVNINTIPTDMATGLSPVWTALLNGMPGPTWPQIIASRRGYGNVGAPVLAVNDSVASAFGNPFRTAGGAGFATPHTPPTATGFAEVDVTMLRRDPQDPTKPLFGVPAAAVLPYTDPTRNPYFRYQNLQRLSNLLTTRSNVYAVWITIGYFEATPGRVFPPAPLDYTVYPDGFQLGQELGSDSGEIKRHRAFYIYDRSIPVGFEPGKDLNFEQGVLLRRFVE